VPGSSGNPDRIMVTGVPAQQDPNLPSSGQQSFPIDDPNGASFFVVNGEYDLTFTKAADA
jgi:hypothetical protein